MGTIMRLKSSTKIERNQKKGDNRRSKHLEENKNENNVEENDEQC